MNAGGVRDCRITGVDTFIVGARWCNWVFAHVHTDDGISGVGEGSCEWQPQAVEAAIRTLARRVAIGESAFRTEHLVQSMFRNEFARGGPILNSACAAIEMACWDIVGKALGRPIHDLLGGRLYGELPAYANAWYGAGASLGEVAAAARAVRDKGYRGLKLDPFTCGRDPDRRALNASIAMVEAVRDAVGPEMEILIDAHGRLSVGTAIDVAAAFERLGVYWFEEPSDPENVEALAKIGRSMRIRLATGERCYTRHHAQALLATHEVAVLQPDIIHVGGILEAKKIAAMADANYVTVSFHNPFGPVATAAAVQLDACTTNIVMQESFCEYTPDWRFDLLDHPPRPEAGRYAIPIRPGLGVGEFRPDAARQHPFDADAFLPMWGQTDWRARF
jgi:galactonate dehydratase